MVIFVLDMDQNWVLNPKPLKGSIGVIYFFFKKKEKKRGYSFNN